MYVLLLYNILSLNFASYMEKLIQTLLRKRERQLTWSWVAVSIARTCSALALSWWGSKLSSSLMMTGSASWTAVTAVTSSAVGQVAGGEVLLLSLELALEVEQDCCSELLPRHVWGL